MSLLDKMSLWDDMAREEGPNLTADELFEGVGEEDRRDEEDGEDEEQAKVITEPQDLDQYSRLIYGSTAYEWLITKLKKTCELQWSTNGAAIDNIRHEILRRFPSRRVSKRRAPDNHLATFQLTFEWPLARIHGVSCTNGIHDLAVVTRCVNGAQASTVEEYFAQAWPVGGSDLLDCVQAAAGHFGCTHRGTSTNSAECADGGWP